MESGSKAQKFGLVLFSLLATLILSPALAAAEEGGSGFYAPGGSGSFFDTMPGRPGFFLAVINNHYTGSVRADLEIPRVGLATFGLRAASDAATLGLFYRIKPSVLGGALAFGVAIPYLWLDVRAAVDGPFGTVEKKDRANGLGDIVIIPFMLGGTAMEGDLYYDVRLSVYTPTGVYRKGELASVGKNYWSFEPGFMFSYLGSRNGWEASGYAAFNFNTTNPATDYRTGTQFHIDGTLAKHWPLAGGRAGIGANGFFYQQIADDSGSGAPLREFKGRTVGIGPVLSYIWTVGKYNMAAELKWLPELSVHNRLGGDYVYLKFGWMF
jgi:hypothetical protein